MAKRTPDNIYGILSPDAIAATMNDIGVTKSAALESMAAVLTIWAALSGALGNGYIREEMGYLPRSRSQSMRIQPGTLGLRIGADRARGGNPRSGHPGNGYRRW